MSVNSAACLQKENPNALGRAFGLAELDHLYAASRWHGFGTFHAPALGMPLIGTRGNELAFIKPCPDRSATH